MSIRGSTWAIRIERRAFNLPRRAAFYADMARFMDGDIPPFRALERMERVARRRRSTRKIANIYSRVRRAMRNGKSMAVAMAREVPGNEAVMLVGTATAGPVVLRRALHEMSKLLDRQMAAKAKLRQALTMNCVSMSVIVGVIFMIMKLVVPQLEASTTDKMAAHMIFAPQYWAIGNALLRYGPYIFAGFIALVVWIVWSLPNWYRNRPNWKRSWFDAHLMPWSFYVRTQATFFLATVAAMMRAGIPMKTILSGMLPYASKWMTGHLRIILGRLAKGHAEVEAIGGNMLPQDTRDRLSIYTLIPDFASIMTRLSDDNFDIYEAKINALQTSLKVINVIILAIFIASTLFMIFDFALASIMSTKLSAQM